MHFHKFLHFGAAVAYLLCPAVNADYYVYATFYDDTACTVNPSVAFSTANPGCIPDEVNKNSIYFQSGEDVDVHDLVFSPEEGCNCQNDCIASIDSPASGAGGEPFCYNLTGNNIARSFRFVDNGGDGAGDAPCAPNTCPGYE